MMMTIVMMMMMLMLMVEIRRTDVSRTCTYKKQIISAIPTRQLLVTLEQTRKFALNRRQKEGEDE